VVTTERMMKLRPVRFNISVVTMNVSLFCGVRRDVIGILLSPAIFEGM